jgi:hypothetical protein
MLAIPLFGTAGVKTKSWHPPPPHHAPPLPAAHRRPRALLRATQCFHVAQPTEFFHAPSSRSELPFQRYSARLRRAGGTKGTGCKKWALRFGGNAHAWDTIEDENPLGSRPIVFRPYIPPWRILVRIALFSG